MWLPDASGGATLRPGARIGFHGGPDQLAERVRLSSGTCLVSPETHQGLLYRDNAFVPRGPWRRPSADELALLRFNGKPEDSAWRPGSDAAIVAIPAELIRRLTGMLDEYGVRDGADSSVYRSVIAKNPRWPENLAALRNYLKSRSAEPPSRLPLRFGEPDQFTVTHDDLGGDDPKRVGLHLDSWDKLPLRHRHLSRNRLCINLGRGPRYSMFFNLPLMDMFSCLKLRDPEDIYEDFRGLALGRRFMTSRPDYPAVRLRIDPGEAYILSTDNFIHDATTQGNGFPDSTLTYLGQFRPCGFAIDSGISTGHDQADALPYRLSCQ